MDKLEYNAKLDELDHLLNDELDQPMQPSRVWDLLADVSRHDLALRPSSVAPRSGTPDFLPDR